MHFTILRRIESRRTLKNKLPRHSNTGDAGFNPEEEIFFFAIAGIFFSCVFPHKKISSFFHPRFFLLFLTYYILYHKKRKSQVKSYYFLFFFNFYFFYSDKFFQLSQWYLHISSCLLHLHIHFSRQVSFCGLALHDFIAFIFSPHSWHLFPFPFSYGCGSQCFGLRGGFSRSHHFVSPW